MGQHWEILIPVVLLALLFFGPKRLPEIGSSIGKTIKEFQKSMREVKEPEPPTAAALPPAATTDAPPPQLPQPSATPMMTSTAPSAAPAAAPPAPSTAATTEPKASETSVS